METARQKFIKAMIAASKSEEHRKYGKLILQTNEVQFYLSLIISVRSASPHKDFCDYLYTGAELGALINLFNACSKSIQGAGYIVSKLRAYNQKRNRLAHKMYSVAKLTTDECVKATEEGDEIIKILKILLKGEIGDFETK
jgi:hypothetical protein